MAWLAASKAFSVRSSVVWATDVSGISDSGMRRSEFGSDAASKIVGS